MTILKVDEITYNANFQLTLEKKRTSFIISLQFRHSHIKTCFKRCLGMCNDLNSRMAFCLIDV